MIFKCMLFIESTENTINEMSFTHTVSIRLTCDTSPGGVIFMLLPDSQIYAIYLQIIKKTCRIWGKGTSAPAVQDVEVGHDALTETNCLHHILSDISIDRLSGLKLIK